MPAAPRTATENDHDAPYALTTVPEPLLCRPSKGREAPIPLVNGEVHLWQVQLPIRDTTLCRAVESATTAHERARAGRLPFEDDRLRQLYTRGMLRILLGHYLSKAPNALNFPLNPWDKPLLEEDPGLHFNVSHAGSLALIGVTRSAPVGVDVETVRPLDDREEQFRRTLCSDELGWIDRFSEPARRNQEFMRLRTGKEAALKALGMGLARHLHSFGVVPPAGPTGPGEVNGLRGRWTLHFPPLPAGFAGAVAITTDNTGPLRVFRVG